MKARNERRRKGVAALLRRLGDKARPVVPRADAITVIYVLLSFDTFNELAGAGPNAGRRRADDGPPRPRRVGDRVALGGWRRTAGTAGGRLVGPIAAASSTRR